MLEHLAGDLELVLLLDDLAELAVDDLLPGSRLVHREEGSDVSKREAHLPEEADDPDCVGGRCGIPAAAARLPGCRCDQAKLVVVTQRARWHARALG